jgi:hypothetical protein
MTLVQNGAVVKLLRILGSRHNDAVMAVVRLASTGLSDAFVCMENYSSGSGLPRVQYEIIQADAISHLVAMLENPDPGLVSRALGAIELLLAHSTFFQIACMETSYQPFYSLQKKLEGS